MLSRGRTPGRAGSALSAPAFTGQVVLAGLVACAALYPLWAALGFIGSDLSSSGEKFDGLGLALGGAILVPVALAGLAGAFWWWRGRGRRAGWVALAVAALLVAAEVGWLALMGWA